MQHLVEQLESDICWLGSSIIDHDTCSLYGVQAAPAVMNNLAAFIVSPEYTCEVEFDYCNFQNYKKLEPHTYSERVLATKPAFLANDDFIDNMYKEIAFDKNERETISIIQFTDLHIDLDYVEGTPMVCNDILCCRSDSVGSMEPDNLAGKYGALAFCDVPETTV